MENFATSTTSQFAMPGVTTPAQRAGVSVAYRNRTVAPLTTVMGIALLPNSDVAEIKGFGTLAGIRSWSPPV